MANRTIFHASAGEEMPDLQVISRLVPDVPFGREIADLLLAVNRAYNKSDYIPTIAWGRNARFCQNLEVGTQVKIVGRVQSRIYEKKYEDGTVEQKVAYEVSICSLELIEQAGDEKEDTDQEAV